MADIQSTDAYTELMGKYGIIMYQYTTPSGETYYGTQPRHEAAKNPGNATRIPRVTGPVLALDPDEGAPQPNDGVTNSELRFGSRGPIKEPDDNQDEFEGMGEDVGFNAETATDAELAAAFSSGLGIRDAISSLGKAQYGSLGIQGARGMNELSMNAIKSELDNRGIMYNDDDESGSWVEDRSESRSGFSGSGDVSAPGVPGYGEEGFGGSGAQGGGNGFTGVGDVSEPGISGYGEEGFGGGDGGGSNNGGPGESTGGEAASQGQNESPEDDESFEFGGLVKHKSYEHGGVVPQASRDVVGGPGGDDQQIKVKSGEYVLPADYVAAVGTEKIEKEIQKIRENVRKSKLVKEQAAQKMAQIRNPGLGQPALAAKPPTAQPSTTGLLSMPRPGPSPIPGRKPIL